ncbi:MAG: hypothetical protein K9L68_10490, partial [Spirochaetales bacterium]|nr:hypothetical protein [Spirochaetales bacterium]MCF7939011.1 hypothetical protein [Spirochaetales bacterium]
MKGYMNKIARINLTAETVEYQELPEETAKLYIGGSGLGAWFLSSETGPETDPLGPDNLLIFAAGPLTGTTIFNSDRFEVVTKSPKTGIYGEASCGGRWGSRFKKCGFDALIITGRSASPVYLNITDDSVEIKDAGSLWGQDTFKTHETLRNQAGKNSEVACI